MRQASERSNAALVWLVPFLALLAAGLLLFALTAWMEGARFASQDGWLWFAHLGSEGALQSLSNAAEVVAAVLGIVITVVAIVVELAANRYTPRITQLFVREPINFVVMGFFVLTALYCTWISATVSANDPTVDRIPTGGVGLAMAMVSLSLVLLLPYFAFVFAFLQPVSIVDRIRAQTFSVVRRATRGYRHGLRPQVVTGIEQLEDVAMNAMEHKDRSISMASVEALFRLLHDYEKVRDELPDAWFDLDRSLAGDPDFVAMAPGVQRDLTDRKVWMEMKVFRQYHTIFVEALNRMRAIAYLVALNTHRIASDSRHGRPEVFELSVRFFNSYMRAAINAGDVRTAYYTLHHYRQLVEECVRTGTGEEAVEMAGYLRYYGQVAFAQKLPFVLEAVAYDIAIINETAFEYHSKVADDLLDIFLAVDKETDSPAQEESLRGVRRSQVQLATFFLLRGDEDRARRVFEDMRHERPERLASIRRELLETDSPDYWEVTDRGVNFAYLPPERRAQLDVFFRWFGDRIPEEVEDDHRPGRSTPEDPPEMPAPAEPRQSAQRLPAG